MIRAEDIGQAALWRQHLHRRPELAFEEHETSRFIAERLVEWGIAVRVGLGGTGVVGTLSRGTSRRVVGIRADMDALPIMEETGLPYASAVPGKMHACGHDGHVATLLAAARACASRDDLDGTVHFIFQPAEENEGGAARMVEDGLFRDFPMDAVYALHNWPGLPVGECVARDDVMMAAFGTFEVTIDGRGCHGAMPHEGVDPIPAACAVVSAFQTIASRNTSPLESAVVSVTQIHAGDTWNVVPGRCVIRGTTRWFSPLVGDMVETRLTAVAEAIASGYGCSATVAYRRRYPATVNAPSAAGRARAVIAATPGLKVVDAKPSMAAEDFAFMLKEVPGCYLWLGAARGGANPGLHSPHFDFNDVVLAHGANLWTRLVGATLGAA